MHRGRAPTVGELAADMGFKNKQRAHYIVQKLVQKGSIKKRRNAGSWQIVEEVDHSSAALNEQTFEKLYSMKLVGMVEALKEQMKRPEINGLSFEERFAMLVDAQYLFRKNKG